MAGVRIIGALLVLALVAGDPALAARKKKGKKGDTVTVKAAKKPPGRCRTCPRHAAAAICAPGR